MHHLPSALVFATLLTTASAQVIGIDDLNPTTGTSNAFPGSLTAGQTSLLFTNRRT